MDWDRYCFRPQFHSQLTCVRARTTLLISWTDNILFLKNSVSSIRKFLNSVYFFSFCFWLHRKWKITMKCVAQLLFSSTVHTHLHIKYNFVTCLLINAIIFSVESKGLINLLRFALNADCVGTAMMVKTCISDDIDRISIYR